MLFREEDSRFWKGHKEFKILISGATTSAMAPETKNQPREMALLNTENGRKGSKKIKFLDGKKGNV